MSDAVPDEKSWAARETDWTSPTFCEIIIMTLLGFRNYLQISEQFLPVQVSFVPLLLWILLVAYPQAGSFDCNAAFRIWSLSV